MSKPLSHRPFEQPLMVLKPSEMKTRRATVTRIHPTVIVRRPGSEPPRALTEQVELPGIQSPESEPEPVAAKKKAKGGAWTPERRAKLKATIAAKKANGEPIGAQARRGKKKEKRKRSAESIAKQRETLKRKKRGKASPSKAIVRQEGATIADLLQAITDATSEIARRLSQLTL